MELGLQRLPWYGQVALFVVVSAMAVGAFSYLYVMPTKAGMVGRRQELDSLRISINRGLATARKLPEFRAQVADLEARLEALKAVLPEEKDVADLLRRLQTLAMQSSLTIRAFKPAPTSTKQIHAEWPIGLELDGTYHNLGSFFDKVSKFSRIINVSGLHIRAKEKPAPSSTISVECVATTFVLLDTAKALPGAATAPTGAKP